MSTNLRTSLTNGDGFAEPTGPSPTPAVLPTIEREPVEMINVAAGGKLFVPREDQLADLDVGTDLDLGSGQIRKPGKPHRHEWVALNPASELPTRLLVHRPTADRIEVEHYYVDPALRGRISDELKSVRVFVFCAVKTNTFGLWVVNVTPGNSWYESLAPLFKQSAEFFRSHAIRVFSDRKNSRYQIMHTDLKSNIIWPTKSTSELLGEALGRERFITSADHWLYRDLVDGTELT